MENPVDEFINGIIGGAEAGASRREFKRIRNEVSKLPNTNLSANAKALRPPSYLNSVFRGFRDASLTPGQRLQAEQMQFVNESRSLEFGLKQQAFNDSRQGLRDAAQLSDSLAQISDPREKLRELQRFPHLARTAPKIYGAMVSAAQEEFKAGLEMGKIQRDADALGLEDQIEQADIALQQEMHQVAPGILRKYRQAKDSGDLEAADKAVADFNAAKSALRPTNSRRFEISKNGDVVFEEGTGIDVTTSTKSRIQQDKLSLDIAMKAMRTLRESLDSPAASRALGVRGQVTQFLNTFGAQFVPKAFDQEAGEIRNQVDTVKEIAKRAVIADRGQFSDRDQKRVDRIFPSTNVFESVDSAKTSLDQMMLLLEGKYEILDSQLGFSTAAESNTITLPSGRVIQR